MMDKGRRPGGVEQQVNPEKFGWGDGEMRFTYVAPAPPEDEEDEDAG